MRTDSTVGFNKYSNTATNEDLVIQEVDNENGDDDYMTSEPMSSNDEKYLLNKEKNFSKP